jgi:hypothetical protein
MSSFKTAVENQLATIAAAKPANATRLQSATTAEEILGIALRPGVRVLDTLTGLEGTVRAATIKQSVIPTT